MGNAGDTGAPGTDGTDGAAGTKGDTGESGPIGPEGQVGATGAHGVKGDTGSDSTVPGPTGAKGEHWCDRTCRRHRHHHDGDRTCGASAGNTVGSTSGPSTVSCPTGTTLLGGGANVRQTGNRKAAVSSSYSSNATTWSGTAIVTGAGTGRRQSPHLRSAAREGISTARLRDRQILGRPPARSVPVSAFCEPGRNPLLSSIRKVGIDK